MRKEWLVRVPFQKFPQLAQPQFTTFWVSASSVQKRHEGDITMGFEHRNPGGSWTTWDIGEKTKIFQQWEIVFAVRNYFLKHRSTTSRLSKLLRLIFVIWGDPSVPSRQTVDHNSINDHTSDLNAQMIIVHPEFAAHTWMSQPFTIFLGHPSKILGNPWKNDFSERLSTGHSWTKKNIIHHERFFSVLSFESTGP